MVQILDLGFVLVIFMILIPSFPDQSVIQFSLASNYPKPIRQEDRRSDPVSSETSLQSTPVNLDIKLFVIPNIAWEEKKQVVNKYFS